MELLDQVESYLAITKMPPSTFGRTVVGDPRFVDDLREGRRPRLQTLQRVHAYMAKQPAWRSDGADVAKT